MTKTQDPLEVNIPTGGKLNLNPNWTPWQIESCQFCVSFYFQWQVFYERIVFCLQTGNLIDSNASEEDKINAMMKQSTMDFDPSK